MRGQKIEIFNTSKVKLQEITFTPFLKLAGTLGYFHSSHKHVSLLSFSNPSIKHFRFWIYLFLGILWFVLFKFKWREMKKKNQNYLVCSIEKNKFYKPSNLIFLVSNSNRSLFIKVKMLTFFSFSLIKSTASK